MTVPTMRPVKPYKGAPMEGPLAHWYASNTKGGMDEFQALARRIAARLPSGAAVLEVAPGPGYLAIEMARFGLSVSSLDISRAFVRIGLAKAAQAGVRIDVRHGDAAAQPFADSRFDFIVCRAAFKNFGDPIGALGEMHRVLRPGGTALIIDMRGDASNASIRDAVNTMKLDPASAWITDRILRSLRKRAYSRDAFARMIADTPFGEGRIAADPIGFEIELTRAA
jgi:ubiquinone/menaquinone biosynthesis C-methylase UbiE